jgi:hypothetical protein
MHLWDKIIINSLSITSLLIIWFKTDAFVSYCQLFNWLNPIKDYIANPTELSYPQFLYINKDLLAKNKTNLFLIKLISCPLCVTLWLSLAICTITGVPFLFLAVYCAALIVYQLTSRII